MADSALINPLVERLTSEGLISMAEAAQLYSRTTHKSTPTRHAVKGVRLPDGRRLKLEAIRVSSALCTSRAAVLRFFAAQQADAEEADEGTTPQQQAIAEKQAATEVVAWLGSNRKPR